MNKFCKSNKTVIKIKKIYYSKFANKLSKILIWRNKHSRLVNKQKRDRNRSIKSKLLRIKKSD